MAYEIVDSEKFFAKHENQSKLNYLHDWFLYGWEFLNSVKCMYDGGKLYRWESSVSNLSFYQWFDGFQSG